MGNTHPHRGGRRSSARRVRGSQGGLRGPSPGGPFLAGPPRPERPGQSGPGALPGRQGPPAPMRRPDGQLGAGGHHPSAAANFLGGPPPEPTHGKAVGSRHAANQGKPSDRHAAERGQPPPFNRAASRRRDLTPPTGPTQDEWKKRSRPPDTWRQAGAPPEGDLLAERDGPSQPQRPRDELRLFSGGSNGHQPAAPAHAGYPPAAPRGASDTSEGWVPRQDRQDLPDRAGRQEREPLRPEVRGEIGSLIDDLRTIFERDRAVASQSGSTRCGICYLHYAQSELEYRDAEGFYVCPTCARALGKAEVFMVRRQQQ